MIFSIAQTALRMFHLVKLVLRKTSNKVNIFILVIELINFFYCLIYHPFLGAVNVWNALFVINYSWQGPLIFKCLVLKILLKWFQRKCSILCVASAAGLPEKLAYLINLLVMLKKKLLHINLKKTNSLHMKHLATGSWPESDNANGTRIGVLLEHYRSLAQLDKFEKEQKRQLKRRSNYLSFTAVRLQFTSWFHNVCS